MFLRISIFSALMCCLVACGATRTSPGSVPSEEQPTHVPSVNLDGVVVETFLLAPVIAAGESAQVTCIVSRDREQLADVPVLVEVTPVAGPVTVSGVSASFTPTQVGTFNVRCMTAGREISDPVGATLQVVPDVIVRIDTTLSENVLRAGVAGAVGCIAHDQFDNEIVDIQALEDGHLLNLDHAVEIIIEPPLGLNFILRGTLAGDFQVACRFGDVVDATPENITILPGLPTNSWTTVDILEALPTDPVQVSCEVEDDYGNILSGYDTVVSILAANGSTASHNGAQVLGHTVSAVLAGEYYVFCAVPGFFAGDESPAQIRVTGGLPFSWHVDLLDQDCFLEGVELPIQVSVVDRWGNLIEDPIFDVEVNPTTGVLGTLAGGLVFSAEGDYDISVGLQGEQDPFTIISPFYANVRVDSTPPQVQIDTPTRAAMMVAGSYDDTLVTVEGTVTDSLSALKEVRVDGRKLNISGNSLTEPFQSEFSSRWGLSVFEASAMDTCGNKAVTQQSFLRSPTYSPASVEEDFAAVVPDGLIVRLNQMAIDDGYRLDIDDLASLMQLLFSGLSLDTALPATLVFSPAGSATASGNLPTATYACSGGNVTQEVTGFWVKKIGTLEHDAPVLEHLTALDGALGFGFSMDGMVLPLQIHASLDMGCGGSIVETITGEVRIGHVGADGSGAVSFAAAGPGISICDTCLTVDFDEVIFDFNWGSLGFMDEMVNELMTNLAASIEAPVENLLAAQIRELVPSLLGGVLGGLNVGTGFSIPPPIDLTLNLFSGMNGAEFSGPAGAGHGTLGLFTQVFPDVRGQGIPEQSLGPITRMTIAPTFGPTYPMGIGMSDNTLNQIMWSMWYGGGFDQEDLVGLAPAANVQGIELSMFAHLPPVVMPGRNGNDIEIGVGDIELMASINLAEALGVDTPSAETIAVRLYLSVVMGGSFHYDPDAHSVRIVFDSEPQVAVEVVDNAASFYEAEIAQLVSNLMAMVMPRLLENSLSSFPIPEFDLGEIAGFQADTWTIQDVSVARKNDYLRLSGRLE